MKRFASLTKLKITLLSTMSTALGYTLAADKLDWQILICLIGTAFLAAGAAALNQVQEKDKDAIMVRTQNRPIPTGKISSLFATLISLVLIISGAWILFSAFSWIPSAIGLLTVLWYNGIYTLLKKKTVYAVIPGAIVGALPPLIGWTSSGGAAFDLRILSVMFFFFIWQVPHFWLLLIIHSEDYKKAGFPVLSEKLNISQLKRVTFVWIIATAVTGSILPLFGILNHIVPYMIFILCGILLTFISLKMLKPDNSQAVIRKVFMSVNLYAVSMMILLSINKGVGL